MAQETELRTYNVRDPAGYLVFSSDDPLEAEEFIDGHADHRLDDFKIGELRERAKERRQEIRDGERAEKEAAERAQAREQE